MSLSEVLLYCSTEGLLKVKKGPLLFAEHTYTVEPLNKGHLGANNSVPCREEVK